MTTSSIEPASGSVPAKAKGGGAKDPVLRTDFFTTAFHRPGGEGPGPVWLSALKREAMGRFEQLGFPTLSHEDWRFTSLAPLARMGLKWSGPAQTTAGLLDGYPFAAVPGPRLVFVDGHYSAALSSVGGLRAGVEVGSLAGVLASGGSGLEGQLGRCPGSGETAFGALNTAFIAEGSVIRVGDGVDAGDPVHLIHVSTGRTAGVVSQPRHLMVVGRGGVLTVLETHLGLGAGGFTNAVTELFAGDDSVVEHIKFQDEPLDAVHVAGFYGRFGRASRVKAHSFAVGARLSRYDIRVCLDGEGLEAVLNGLYLTRGDMLADHHMVVNHAKPHCASHEYFNGILDDRSKGVFHGRILVQPEAQKTDAKQTNKNLLLSDEATADAKPQLEIYADDVKCTHGATIGQLNDESIFYLRSRGIGLERARRMLMHSFAGEIVDRIGHEAARGILDRLVWDRLEQNPLIADAAVAQEA